MADSAFVEKLNKLVQDFFTNTQLSYDEAGFLSDYTDKASYVYAMLIKTKGPDLVKLSNLRNPLADWERPGTFGGYVRGLSVNPVDPIDSPTFADGSSPDQYVINKAKINATYHPLRARSEFAVTQFPNQLDDVFNNSDEAGFFLASILDALSAGVMDTLFRVYKQVIYKYWADLPAAIQARLTSADIPATASMVDMASAKAGVNAIRNYVTDFMFGKDQYNSLGFRHAVDPSQLRLYIIPELANKFTDMLVLDHYMEKVSYTNIAANLSAFLGLQVRVLDDLGGRIPYDSTDAQLYPIFNADGAVTGTYAATEGGTTPVTVDHWGPAADYPFRAMLTEDDFGLSFTNRDTINTAMNARGGGYINTFRFTDRLLVANPACNTIYFK